jgi:hypothetical protein
MNRSATFFLDQDLTPAARVAGFTPVYADLAASNISPECHGLSTTAMARASQLRALQQILNRCIAVRFARQS